MNRETADDVLWLGHTTRKELLQLADAGLPVRAALSLGPDEPHALVTLMSSPIDLALVDRLREESLLVALAAPEATTVLLEAGVHDVVRDDIGMEELVLRVRRWSEVSRQRRRARQLESRMGRLRAKLVEIRTRQEQLRRQALSDELTGIGNRRSFRQALELWLAFVNRKDGSVSVILFDLDDFKLVNDRQGHAAGDALLRSVAQTLRASLRSIDHVARIGGDEFAVILPMTRLSGATEVAERIQRSLGVEASFGVATASQEHGLAPDELTARADAALYQAKNLGKRSVKAEPRSEER